MVISDLPGILPDVGEADGGMKAIVDTERNRDVAEDGPRLRTVELNLQGVVIGLLRLESVNDPHGEVAEQQESDILSPRLLPLLDGVGGGQTVSSQHEDGLHRRL